MPHFGFRNSKTLNEVRQTATLVTEIRDSQLPIKIRGNRSFSALWPDWGIEVGRRAYRCWKARRKHQWRTRHLA